MTGYSFGVAGGKSTKYATAYKNGTGAGAGNGTNLIETVCKTGDAVKEIGRRTATQSWFSDASQFVFSSNPFWERGGYHGDGASAGVFHSYYYSGGARGYDTFRNVIIGN